MSQLNPDIRVHCTRYSADISITTCLARRKTAKNSSSPRTWTAYDPGCLECRKVDEIMEHQTTFDPGPVEKTAVENAKTCRKCDKKLPATPEYFTKSKNNPDGLHSYCKNCIKNYNRERYVSKAGNPLPSIRPRPAITPATPPPTHGQATPAVIMDVCDEIKSILLEKNASYGDSAINPIRIFSHADPIEQINVRIDDKLSRMIRGHRYPGDNDEMDLIGYLILKRVAVRIINEGRTYDAKQTSLGSHPGDCGSESKGIVGESVQDGEPGVGVQTDGQNSTGLDRDPLLAG